MADFTEQDIIFETEHFFVLHNRKLKRHEVLKKRTTHSAVVGWGTEAACVRTAQRLEPYHRNVD